MKKQRSKLADEIVQEKKRQEYFKKLAKRKKVGGKDGRTTKQ